MAGDNVSSAGSSMYVPREFTALGLPSLLQARCRDIADRYHADLVRDVATEGWPPPKVCMYSCAIQMCDMAHSNVCHDSFICAA